MTQHAKLYPVQGTVRLANRFPLLSSQDEGFYTGGHLSMCRQQATWLARGHFGPSRVFVIRCSSLFSYSPKEAKKVEVAGVAAGGVCLPGFGLFVLFVLFVILI